MPRNASRAWAQRTREERQRGPWRPDEDSELVDMVRYGLAIEFVKVGERSFGEMLLRRLELVEQGVVTLAKDI